MALPPDESDAMMQNPDPGGNEQQNEQQGLFDPDIYRTNVITGSQGTRQQRGGEVQRVQIVGYDDAAARSLQSLNLALERLERLYAGGQAAPEATAKIEEHAKEKLKDAERLTRAQKSQQDDYVAALKGRIPLESEISRYIGLQGEQLDNLLKKHKMLSDSNDIDKKVTYRYMETGADAPKEVETTLSEVEKARQAAKQGTATEEQELALTRIKHDIVAREVSDSKSITNEYAKRVKALQEQVKLEEKHEVVRKRVDSLMKRGSGQIMQELRNQGLISGEQGQGVFMAAHQTDEGEVISEHIHESEVQRLIKMNQTGKLTEAADQARFRDIQNTLMIAMAGSAGKSGTGIASDTQHFRINELIGALARGNFGAALGEGLQHLPGTDRITAGAERLSGRMSTSLSRVLPGSAGSAIGGFIGKLPIGLAAVATTPAGIAGAIEAARYGIGQYHESDRLGMITGEGAGAGFSARGAAFMQGINPFDLVSGRMATEFQTSVRQQGYRGDQANQMANVLGDVVNHLGTDWKQALDMTTLATREGGASLSDFRTTLMGLRDMAKDTGTSVQSLQEGLAEFSKTSIAAGATQHTATLRFGAAQTALAGTALGLPQGSQRLQSWMNQSASIIAMSAGVPIWQAMSMSANQWARQLDKLVSQIMRQKPQGMSDRNWAEMLIAMQHPLFAGLDVPGALALMKGATTGGGFEGALSQERAVESGQQARRREQQRQNQNWHRMSGLDQIIHDPVRRLTDNLKDEVHHAHQVASGIWGGITHVFSSSDKAPNERASDRAFVQGYVQNLQSQHLTAQQEVQKVQVEIKANPQLLRYFEVADPVYQQYLRGLHGGQGMVKPPGGH